MRPGMILRVEMTQEGVWCEIKKVKKKSQRGFSVGGRNMFPVTIPL